MASEYQRPGAVPPIPSTRARRIPDEKWDTHREKLVKLYIEEEASQKDIIDIMTKEHNFIITEKQLKHRFQKWNVRKHISSSDMGVILSLKRKHDAATKGTKIQYQGHALNNDRLERASKRRKDHITTPPFVPSHITLGRSPLRSPQRTQIATSVGYSNVSNGFVVPDSNCGNLYSNRAVNAASTTIDFLPDLPPDLELPDGQSWSPFPELLMSQSFDLEMSPEKASATPIPTTFESMLLEGGTVGQGSTPDPTEKGEMLGANVESATIFQHSRFPPSLEVPAGPPKQPALCSASPNRLLLSGGHALAMSRMSNDNLFYVANDGQSTLEAPIGISAGLARVSLHGTDPESIIPPLQLMRSQLSMCLDVAHPETHLWGSRSSRNQLVREITSDWLLSEIDDILCWSYDISASLIRQRRAGEGNGRSRNQQNLSKKYHDGSRIPESDDGNIWIGRSASQPRGRLTGSIKAGCRTRGTFQVQLREVAENVIQNHNHQSSCFITISFIPEVSDRTMGISVAFTRFLDAKQHPRLCPTITAFNVIPEDSEIITYVKQNDLKGVQRLLDERKASITDVHPYGFSLLFYALFSGCSDIYRLLLQGGASTEVCKVSDQMGVLIDCIWILFIHFTFYPEEMREFPTKNLTDINQCVAMTDLALKHGCEAGGHFLGNSSTPTPLFVLSRVTWIDNGFSSFPTLLGHLLAAGYEMEDHNAEGQTPLLFAAHLCQHTSLALLKQFVSLGANIHAADNEGRGALHQVLDFRESLKEVYEEIYVKGRVINTCWYNSDHDSDSDDDTKFYDPYGYGDDDPHHYISEYDIDDFNTDSGIGDWEADLPRCRQKTRTRYKLLTLLKAGCNPNVLDNELASPTDYARIENLLPQWEWALVHSGYMYDEDKQEWIRNVSFSDTVDMTAGE